jgi:hypothetical protein
MFFRCIVAGIKKDIIPKRIKMIAIIKRKNFNITRKT